jgi:type IV pilus assembly protein PilA
MLGELSIAQETSREEAIKAQIGEGLNFSAGIKAAIYEFYLEHERFPENNAEAGIVEPIRILGKYVVSIAVGAGDGSIIVEYGNNADPVISGATLTLKATIKKPRPVWSCTSDYIDAKFFPEGCNN